MKKIVVEGGHALNGEIKVSGSKNAALPIIFSCILINGTSKIKNLPDIGDVRVALRIISDLGAVVERLSDVTYIDTTNLTYKRPSEEQVSKIRASTYLMGACLKRFGKCHILPFGGCDFSHRPIDMHLSACLSLGGVLSSDLLIAKKLVGAEIIFDKPSVGATVNAILLSASAEGDSIIRGCAIETHIDALIDFINSAGGDVKRRGTDIFVKGRELCGGEISIIADMIEAGSYLAAGLMCGGEVKVFGCKSDEMTSVLDRIHNLGAQTAQDQDFLRVSRPSRANYLALTAEPYPGFPTDLQPIFAPLMALYSGGEISDLVWPTRFKYLDSLSAFGVASSVKDGRAEIYKSTIHSGRVASPDLRGGFACLLAALFARGRSEIYSAELILRGYEKLEEKLSTIGARIKIENA